jgi:hypothetical protein
VRAWLSGQKTELSAGLRIWIGIERVQVGKRI